LGKTSAQSLDSAAALASLGAAALSSTPAL
jgi:hypothetical protein